MKTKPIVIEERQIAANVRAAEVALNTQLVLPDDGAFLHDRIVGANASLFTESYFSEPLTQYAVGFKDPSNLDAEVNFIAPPVQTPRRFEYAASTNFEEFLSDADDERPIGADFKQVRYTSDKVTAKTANRGLKICIDLDEVADKANWREVAVGKLLRRLRRNQHRRAFALLSAAATNNAKTWDTTAGKDPDQDVIVDLITGADLSGFRNNRIVYGDTAWSKRALAHRAQASAGGFASAGLTPEQLAGVLGVDSVLRSTARYATSATAKSQVVSNKVVSFFAQDGMDTEDSSHIKRFWTPTLSGDEFRVYEQQISEKLYTIVVECYELMKITATVGIRQFTVS